MFFKRFTKPFTKPFTIRNYSNLVKRQYIPYSYCGSCGTQYGTLMWPRSCRNCSSVTFRNPIPVAVGIMPFKVNNNVGVLVAKRAVKPYIGEYALPGGFVDWTESWKEALSREIMEETTVKTDPEEFFMRDVLSTPDNTRILIFALSKKIRTLKDIQNFQPNDEVSELLIGNNQTLLCFFLHQQIYNDFFKHKGQYLTE